MRPPYAGLDRLTPVLFVPKWPPLLFSAAGTPENGLSSLPVAKRAGYRTLQTLFRPFQSSANPLQILSLKPAKLLKALGRYFLAIKA